MRRNDGGRRIRDSKLIHDSEIVGLCATIFAAQFGLLKTVLSGYYQNGIACTLSNDECAIWICDNFQGYSSGNVGNSRHLRVDRFLENNPVEPGLLCCGVHHETKKQKDNSHRRIYPSSERLKCVFLAQFTPVSNPSSGVF